MIFCGFLLGVAWTIFGFLVWDGIKFRKELKAGLDMNHSDGSLLMRQLQALRQYAGKNPEFAEIMRGLSLL